GIPVDAVKKAVDQHARIDLVPQALVLPDCTGLTIARLEETAALVVAGRQKHLVATDDRIRGVDAVVRRPFDPPEFLAGVDIHGDVLGITANDREPLAAAPKRQRR